MWKVFGNVGLRQVVLDVGQVVRVPSNDADVARVPFVAASRVRQVLQGETLLARLDLLVRLIRL